MAEFPYLVFDGAGRQGSGVFHGPAAPSLDALPPGAVMCTQDEYDASGPWTTLVDGAIVIGSPPGPSPAEQAIALLVSGLTVTSTGTPDRSGVYPCSALIMAEITSELVSIMANGAFADGSTTILWHDTAGADHEFDIPGFKELATKIGAFTQPLLRIIRTDAGTLPPASATIA